MSQRHSRVMAEVIRGLERFGFMELSRIRFFFH